MDSVAALYRGLRDVVKSRPIAILTFVIGLILMLISIDGLVPGVQLSDRFMENCAAIGTGLAFLAGTAVFFFPGQGRSAVGYLLVEHGELSLGRTQVFLWLLPAVSIYGGMVLPHLTLIQFPPQLLPILGGSLATAVLGAATAPTKDALDVIKGTPNGPIMISQADPPSPPKLRLIQLVEDFRDQGDITRYQFLFLTTLGSVMLLAGYLASGNVPDIPQDLLYLMGGSALGYLGTKTVKSVSIENEASRKR